MLRRACVALFAGAGATQFGIGRDRAPLLLSVVERFLAAAMADAG